jgi:hypothetical protein
MAAILFVAGVQFHGRYSFRNRSSVSLPLSVLWPKFIRAFLIQQQQRLLLLQQQLHDMFGVLRHYFTPPSWSGRLHCSNANCSSSSIVSALQQRLRLSSSASQRIIVILSSGPALNDLLRIRAQRPASHPSYKRPASHLGSTTCFEL